MASSGASIRPIRLSTNSEVPLPLLPADRAFPTGSHVWKVDFDIASATPTGGFNMVILKDIDPEGLYIVPRAQPTPVATVVPPAVTAEDASEPVTLLILQGDLNFHHQRSQEDPPAPYLDEEDFEVEMDAGYTELIPGKVTDGNVATLGLLDEGAAAELGFGSVLEVHVPGSAK